MDLPRLILASASPRRAELLRQLGMDFEIIPGEAEELQPPWLTPREICQGNAHRKARLVARQYPQALVLGADTIVCLEDDIFGKPVDQREAEQMLSQLQGRTHRVITGFCLMQHCARVDRTFSVVTRVTFRPLNIEQIREYLSKVNPLDKAGAYAIQEEGETIIESIEGSYSNVVGLPLERIKEELSVFQQSRVT